MGAVVTLDRRIRGTAVAPVYLWPPNDVEQCAKAGWLDHGR